MSKKIQLQIGIYKEEDRKKFEEFKKKLSEKIGYDLSNAGVVMYLINNYKR